MLQKAARILYKISEIMELIMAFAVAICIAIAIIRFFPETSCEFQGISVARPEPKMPRAGKPSLPNTSSQLRMALRATARIMMMSAQRGRSSAEMKERSTI